MNAFGANSLSRQLQVQHCWPAQVPRGLDSVCAEEVRRFFGLCRRYRQAATINNIDQMVNLTRSAAKGPAKANRARISPRAAEERAWLPAAAVVLVACFTLFVLMALGQFEPGTPLGNALVRWGICQGPEPPPEVAAAPQETRGETGEGREERNRTPLKEAAREATGGVGQKPPVEPVAEPVKESIKEPIKEPAKEAPVVPAKEPTGEPVGELPKEPVKTPAKPSTTTLVIKNSSPDVRTAAPGCAESAGTAGGGWPTPGCWDRLQAKCSTAALGCAESSRTAGGGCPTGGQSGREKIGRTIPTVLQHRVVAQRVGGGPRIIAAERWLLGRRHIPDVIDIAEDGQMTERRFRATEPTATARSAASGRVLPRSSYVAGGSNCTTLPSTHSRISLSQLEKRISCRPGPRTPVTAPGWNCCMSRPLIERIARPVATSRRHRNRRPPLRNSKRSSPFAPSTSAVQRTARSPTQNWPRLSPSGVTRSSPRLDTGGRIRLVL